MDYHQPDSRWEAVFSIPNFETYQERLVVKGLFHPIVPEDVVNAYDVAEYMMAHAYYHYPLYEEAFSKLLRITEMAVKFRCTQLEIELKKPNKSQNKPLSILIDELCAAEPDKDLKLSLDITRKIRNIFMHPDRHNYSGAMCKSAIQSAITLLNKMFIPGLAFTSFRRQIMEVNEQLSLFHQEGPFVLEYQEKSYLIESIKIQAAILLSDEWIYYFVANPVLQNIGNQLKNHSYTLPLLYVISDLTITEETISAKEKESNISIKLRNTNNQGDLVTFKDFTVERNNSSKENKLIYEQFITGEIALKENEFWYKWLWKI